MIRCLLFFVLFCVVTVPASAVYEKQDGFPWNLKLHGYHDRELAEKLGEGFFMNVGPTGIRAQITHKHPTAFTVRFVFSKSPAAGKVRAGDVIVGANGKYMTTAHQFGRRTVTGWDGPMTGMAKLIEDAQGKDGKLELIVWPNGVKKDEKKVEIKIATPGRFSKTFPYNCERSDKLMVGLCDFLVQEYEREGKFGRPHAHGAAILALMASGENKYSKLIRRVMTQYQGKRYDPENGGGFPTWGWGYDGIVMGEYYMLTKDKSLVPAMQSLAAAYRDGQDWRSGGYMHKPFAFITRRIASGGPKGYGSMSQPGGLAMVAQSIFEQAGLKFDEECYQRIHQAFVYDAGPNGEIGYGFKAWEHAVIEVLGDSRDKVKNKRGIGFRLADGLEGIDEFKVVWPTPKDPRYRPLDWIKKEKKNVRAYISNKNQLMLVRDMSQKTPTKPIAHNGRRTGHYGRAGLGAIAHSIGSKAHPEWKYMARHLGQSCANSPESIFDGHASTLMHTHWGSLGAFHGGEKAFRHYMEGIKWWFIMGQTHDGGFVPMPGRDYASTDHVYATRVMPSAIAALILSVKEKKLQITGASSTFRVPVPGGESENASPSDEADTPQPTQASPPSMATEILGSGFIAKHSQAQAKQLDSATPYAKIFDSLALVSAKGNEQAEEAELFGEKLRGWLTQRNNKLIEQALSQPAKTLARSAGHMRRLDGMDDLGAATLRAMLEMVGGDADIRTLSRCFQQYDEIMAAEAERGPSQATTSRKQQVTAMLERLLAQPDLSGRLTKEAQGLLNTINAQ
ncbi:MAG: hypothetical protein KTR15_04050 [Phycisphaeraceae bacterium]|nr:hypothetical protein [Phycisphaeraceae bacterium]